MFYEDMKCVIALEVLQYLIWFNLCNDAVLDYSMRKKKHLYIL